MVRSAGAPPGRWAPQFLCRMPMRQGQGLWSIDRSVVRAMPAVPLGCRSLYVRSPQTSPSRIGSGDAGVHGVDWQEGGRRLGWFMTWLTAVPMVRPGGGVRPRGPRRVNAMLAAVREFANMQCPSGPRQSGGTDRACPHLPEGEGAKARSCRGTPAYPRARCAPVLPLPTLALRGDHGVLQPKHIVNQCLGEVGEEQLIAAGVAA